MNSSKKTPKKDSKKDKDKSTSKKEKEDKQKKNKKEEENTKKPSDSKKKKKKEEKEEEENEEKNDKKTSKKTKKDNGEEKGIEKEINEPDIKTDIKTQYVNNRREKEFKPDEIRNKEIATENLNLEQLKEGDIAIRCWNCKGVHIARKEWRVMQCPICNAMNRLPGESSEIEELMKLIKATTVVSYKDTQNKIPIVHYLVLCPYCRTENKVRETAYHCICYRCKNRFPLGKKDGENPNTNEEEFEPPPKTPNNEGMFYKYDIKTNRVYPPERVMRFSELFYPDPMVYPGYYPINSISPLYPNYFGPLEDFRYQKRQNLVQRYYQNVVKYNSGQNNPDKLRIRNMLDELNGKVDRLLGENKVHREPSSNISTNTKVSSYENVFFNKYRYLNK